VELRWRGNVSRVSDSSLDCLERWQRVETKEVVKDNVRRNVKWLKAPVERKEWT
jgi:hypothetical protein